MVYSQFRGLVDQGKVASARFDDSSQRVYFELRPEYLRQVRTAAGDLAWPEGARSPRSLLAPSSPLKRPSMVRSAADQSPPGLEARTPLLQSAFGAMAAYRTKSPLNSTAAKA